MRGLFGFLRMLRVLELTQLPLSCLECPEEAPLQLLRALWLVIGSAQLSRSKLKCFTRLSWMTDARAWLISNSNTVTLPVQHGFVPFGILSWVMHEDQNMLHPIKRLQERLICRIYQLHISMLGNVKSSAMLPLLMQPRCGEADQHANFTSGPELGMDSI